ncbi:VC2046/SO_2500 family protein, partial [Pseudoalteromonas aliena]
MQFDDLLITESQLKSKLNNSIHEIRRGDFALLLAMLS